MNHYPLLYIKNIFILFCLILIFEPKMFHKNFDFLDEYKKIEKYLKVCI